MANLICFLHSRKQSSTTRVLATFLFVALINTGCSSMGGSKSSETGEIYFSSGVGALNQGLYTEALSSLFEANKLLPNRPDVATHLGLAHAYKGNLAEAETAFRDALKMASDYTNAKANLATLLMNQKKYPEAESIFKDGLRDLLYKDRVSMYINLARLYRSTSRPILAEQQLRLALKENPSNCSCWFELGTYQKERGEFSEAAQSLGNAVLGNCYNNPDVHYEIGELLLKTKNMAGAKAKFLDIIELFPTSKWAKKAETTLHLLE